MVFYLKNAFLPRALDVKWHGKMTWLAHRNPNFCFDLTPSCICAASADMAADELFALYTSCQIVLFPAALIKVRLLYLHQSKRCRSRNGLLKRADRMENTFHQSVRFAI